MASRLLNSENKFNGEDPTSMTGTELPPLKWMTPKSRSDDSSSAENSSKPYPLLTPQHMRRKKHSQDGDATRRNSIAQDDEGAPIFQVVFDRIEDEMEAHAYDDLVPLEVKLALEDKVFGWTHLTSSIIGHLIFTGGAYWLTYQFITTAFDHVRVISMEAWASRVRTFLCVWAAVTTFRIVRRRRHVWFRSAYGSKSYKEDAERRRKQVAETDRATALGRFVQSFRHRRVISKLRKAENRFAKKHKESLKHRRAMSMDTDSTMESSERRFLLERKNSADSCDSSSSDESRTTEIAMMSLPGTEPSRDQLRCPSFNTKSTSRMHSYAHDEILMDEPIRNMPYAHGGFFGAAPFMLSNPHWISLLRHLMPDVYVEISRRVAINPPSRLIHWAENNPVVAAYGAAHTLDESANDRLGDSSSPAKFPNLEWDVFLDPALVRRVQLVLDQHAEFRRQLGFQERSKEQIESIEAYYRQELKERSQELVDKMLIAHGNALHLGIEQLGIWKDLNYSRVKRTRRTLGGGIYARQWMAVFAEALKLGVCHEDEHGSSASPSKPGVGSSKTKVSSLYALAETTCPESSIEESVEIVEQVTRSKNPVGLVLDLKSRHVPHHIWAIVVDTLRNAGVRVEGVASFYIDEIRDLSRFSTIGPIPSMIFCHSAGDVQSACHEGKIKRGDKVFFNAGCLLRCKTPASWSELMASFDPMNVKESYQVECFGLPRTEAMRLRSCLEDYKERYNLHIGVYVQEFAIDEAAVQILVKLVNQYSSLYDLGFSWGGINGITIKGIAPGRFTLTDGYWNQRHIGQTWNYSLHPPSTQSVAAMSAPASPLNCLQ